MKRIASSISVLILAATVYVGRASAQLIPSADGQTVYDAHLHARWLADANFAHSPEGKIIASGANISTITLGGSMDYPTAISWLGALNGWSGGAGYLGHNTWTLPTSPVDDGTQQLDQGCTSTGPGGNKFGYACTFADMAGLYSLKTSLGLQWPNTAVPIADLLAGPFHNFQPYLYWTVTNDTTTGHGYHTFSFNAGFAGSNSTIHYIYVLPMVWGAAAEFGLPVNYTPSGFGSLRVSPDGLLVYDPDINVTWLADANLAKSQPFGAQCDSYSPPPNEPAIFPAGISCIASDGAMAHNTAFDENYPDNPNKWLTGLNHFQGQGWLGISTWQLPPDPGECDGFHCLNTPLGHLYKELGLTQGTPIVDALNSSVGPFYNVQPYLYWSCGAPVTNPPCQTITPPAIAQEWSFSFGSGFQGTDLQINDLYVMVYFKQTAAQALIEAINIDLSGRPQLNGFLAQANAIISAPNSAAKAGALTGFVSRVNASIGSALSAAQAEELIALAQIN
ncbi:MAG TPA: hypothetical protein VFO34_12785 [Candidatus Acidoferrales bacterium]|nr:hypothetical protein [Candidatus Acidoferrales bacterium]